MRSCDAIRAEYSVAGRRWVLTTNSPAILEAARLSFPDGEATPDLSLGLKLDIRVSRRLGSEWLQSPICRGRDYLAFCYLGGGSAIVFDYRTRTAVGLVSQTVAANTDLWRTIVFPFALGLMSPVLGAVPLHAACFEYRGAGVLIAARSGAGKSTLAAVLAKRRLTYVADDWAYLTGDRGLRVFALPVGLKLLPDAPRYFPELAGRALSRAENGEMSFMVDPYQTFGAPTKFRCIPNIVLLFDRVPGAALQVNHATREDIRAWFSESLDSVPECLATRREEQLSLLDRLAANNCYRVIADGTPDQIATQLLHVCDGQMPIGPSLFQTNTRVNQNEDLLHRSVVTPFRNTVEVCDTPIEIVADSPGITRQFQPADGRIVSFSVAVVTESSPWNCERGKYAYWHRSLGYKSFGRGGLIAFNSDTGDAAAFLSPATARTGVLRRALERICSRSLTAASVLP